MSGQDKKEETVFGFESSQFLRIPLNRIGAVIGIKGSIREQIERKTDTIIIIDSDTGEVEVRPKKNLKDPVLLLKSRDIIKAIGRGFSSDQALKLANDDSFLEIIRLKSIVGQSPNQLKRIRSRVIGTQGKTRQSVEELTGVAIVVSGSTISLIGDLEDMGLAKESIINIIKGSSIESVLGHLENLKKQNQKEANKLWKSDDDKLTMKELFPDEEKEEDIFKDFSTED